MTTELQVEFIGDKQMKIMHALSNSVLLTDAPLDNNGKGRAFSPTDLVGGALLSCMMTIMSIVAERDQVSLTGMRGKVLKNMSTSPRRIGTLDLEIEMPRILTEAQRTKFENAAKTCPVHHSLHPDVKVTINFIYTL